MSSTGSKYRVACLPEELSGGIAYAILIFHQKNSFCSRDRQLALFQVLRLNCCLDGWEIDLERRTHIQLALDEDLPSALLYDAEHNGETQPGAFALLLGCEEWFKEMGLSLCAHTTSVVAYRNHDEVAR